MPDTSSQLEGKPHRAFAVLEQVRKLASYTALTFVVVIVAVVALGRPTESEAFTYTIQGNDSQVATSTYGNWLTQTFTGVAGVPTSFTISVKGSGTGGSSPTTYRLHTLSKASDSTFVGMVTQNFITEGYPITLLDKEFDLTTQCTRLSFALPTTTNISFTPSEFGLIQFSRQTFTEIGLPCGKYGNPSPMTIPYVQDFTNLGHDFDSFYVITTSPYVGSPSSPLNSFNTRFTSTPVVQDNGNNETNIDVEYFIDPDEQNPQENARTITLVRLENAYGTTSTAYYNSLGATPTGTADTFTIKNPPPYDPGSTTYADILITFANGSTIFGAPRPFPEAYMVLTLRFVDGVFDAVVDQQNFEGLTSLSTSIDYEECSLSNLSGCLNNSVRFLFVPSDESVNELLATNSQLFERIPFIYLSEMRTIVSEVFDTQSNQALSLDFDLQFGTIPVLSESILQNAPYVSLIKSLISALLYLAFAFAMYRIGRNIFNPAQS